MKSTHSDNLERWLGAHAISELSRNMRGWYGSPIPVAGIPGNVYVCADGDFVGECRGGYESTFLDFARDYTRRLRRGIRRVASRRGVLQTGGFASLADLISEGNNGKRQVLHFNGLNMGTLTGGVTSMYSTAGTGGWPLGNTLGGAAPGGTVYTNSTAGGFVYTNPPSGDKSFIGRCAIRGINDPSTLILVDRLFSVAKTMSSTGTEAVTGVPTRYQSTTATDPDYAGNNFLYIGVANDLGSGAHNWTVCQYTNQAGVTGQTMPSLTGVNSQFAPRQDWLATGNVQWFVPLAAGDTGIKALTQMQCSASITGAVDFSINHPLAFIPVNVVPYINIIDGIKSSFNLSRVFDNASLSLFNLTTNTTASLLAGDIEIISG